MAMANSEPAGIGTQCTCSQSIIKGSIQINDDSGNNKPEIPSLKSVVRLRQLFFDVSVKDLVVRPSLI